MKIKNLNFIERHVEKIALAVGAVFLLAVVWFFVLGSPYTVEITGRGGAQKATAQEVEQMIRQRAGELERDVNRKELPFDRIPLPSWTTDFRHRLTGRFLPVDQLATPLGQPGLDRSLIAGTAVVNPRRVVPQPPAPTEVIAKADYAVLAHAADTEQESQLVQLIGQIPTPRDFRYVSVAATFEMEAWRNLLKDPRTPADQRIPEDWWRNRLSITQVTLERQQLDPATGQWGQVVAVAAIPAEQPVFQDESMRYTSAEVTPLLENIHEWQERLARPAFVELERGLWTPPGSEQGLSEAQARELVDVLQRLATLRRRLAAAQPAATSATPRQPAPAARPTPARRPSARPGTPDDPAGMPPVDAAPQPATAQPAHASTDAASSLEAQIAELEIRRDELLGIARPTPLPSEQPAGGMEPWEQDPAMQPPGWQSQNNRRPRPARPPGPGVAPGVRPGATPGVAPGGRPGQGAANGQDRPGAVPALPPVKLWAHDLTVKPGQTYRYRVVVSVVSPLFHVNDVPREQYTEYFNRLSLPSAPSAWTEPVQVDPELHFFMTASDAGRRQATVDVFRIFNGVWVKQSFDVRAGDPIGGVVSLPYQNQPMPVSMDTGKMVVDVVLPPATVSGSAAAAQTRLLAYDLGAKRMADRVLASDLQDPVHQRIIREMHIRGAMLATHADLP